MRWQCTLLKRWLPEYPDGDLPAWAKRWLQAHVAECSACRQELAGLRKVVTAIQTAPVGDPGAEFWDDFSRTVHLRLAQIAQEDQTIQRSSNPRWLRLPYLLGAPALAALLLWVAVNLTGPGHPVQNQALVKPEAASKLAAIPHRAPVPPTAGVAAPVAGVEQFVSVALEEGATAPAEEIDISGWDLDSELVGMTDQEKEIFLKRMHQRAKDGSCIEKYSLCSWG
jgi:anti-sigma factor RsiW